MVFWWWGGVRFVEMNFLAWRAGSRPDGRGTLSCFAKEKYPKEGRAEVRAAARFLAHPAQGEHHRVHVAQRRVSGSSGRFLCLLSLSTQRKQVRCRAHIPARHGRKNSTTTQQNQPERHAVFKRDLRQEQASSAPPPHTPPTPSHPPPGSPTTRSNGH